MKAFESGHKAAADLDLPLPRALLIRTPQLAATRLMADELMSLATRITPSEAIRELLEATPRIWPDAAAIGRPHALAASLRQAAARAVLEALIDPPTPDAASPEGQADPS